MLAAETRARELTRLGGGFYALVALFAIGLAVFSGKGASLLGQRAWPALAHLLGGIAIGLAIVGLVHVGMRVSAGVERAAAALADLVGRLSLRQSLWLAACSAVAEELLFRGALWAVLDHPLVATTCLFGLVHVLPRRVLWGYPLFALVAGLLLGLLRDGTQSVLPCILTHFVVNAMNLFYLGRHRDRLVALHPGVVAKRA